MTWAVKRATTPQGATEGYGREAGVKCPHGHELLKTRFSLNLRGNALPGHGYACAGHLIHLYSIRSQNGRICVSTPTKGAPTSGVEFIYTFSTLPLNARRQGDETPALRKTGPEVSPR